MKITKRQLRRIIREAWTEEDEQRSREYWAATQGRETAKSMTTPDDPAAMGPPQRMGAEEDKSAAVWEAVQQNVEEPSFAEFLGKELETGPDPEMIMDAVQQNLNDPRFVDWLYKELALDGYL